MANVDFPDDLLMRTRFSETIYRPLIISEMDDGPIHSRPRWTSSRRVFTVELTLRGDDDRETLLDFLDDVGGGVCNFVHPTTGEQIEVIVRTEKVQMQYLRDNVWTVQLELIEADQRQTGGGGGPES